jgi:LEA14-like dessication related protein
MLTRALRLLVAVLGVALVSSCATIPKDLKSPTFEVVRIEMQSSDMFAQRFKIRLNVTNPNDIEMPIKALDYKLFLMGDSFGEGKTEERFVLPAKGDAEFDMLLTTNFVSSLGRLISRMGGGKLEKVDYEIAGNVMLDKGFVRKLPFDHKGTVDFGKLIGEAQHGTL